MPTYTILPNFMAKSTISHHRFNGYALICKKKYFYFLSITKLKTDLKLMPVKFIIHHADVSGKDYKLNDCY